MTYLIGIITLVAFFTGVYVLALIRNDYSTVDVFWGLAQVAMVGVLLVIFTPLSWSVGLVLSALSLWGVRLSYYLFKRNWHKPEDFRYQAMRKKWVKFEKLQAYFNVFLLQSAFAFLMSMSVLALMGETTVQMPYVFGVGGALFITGFIFEALADHQLMQFKAQAEKHTILDTGVWGLSRHPNYFGEVTLWWGIGLMALAHASTGLTALLMMISPITITYLLLFLSGIPLLEKRYEGNADYEAYQSRVRPFFPFPKKNRT